MKAKLTFDLKDPDDNADFQRAVQYQNYHSALWEIAYNLNKKITWELEQDENLSDFEVKELIFSKINDILEENNVIL